MKTRIFSSLVLLPLMMLPTAYGGKLLHIGVILVAMMGMYEFYRAFSPGNYFLHAIGYTFAAVYLIFVKQMIEVPGVFPAFVALFVVALLLYTVILHEHTTILQAITSLFGFFYAAFLLSHIYLIREGTHGVYFVWLIFLAAWGCDTGAYFTGMLIGRHKLIPKLSPKKTVEGAVGGVVVATVLGILYGVLIEWIFAPAIENMLFLCGAICFFGSILSQIGDLAASAMKRHTGIKDFGNLIPGHGGMLDRFDSVVMTAPVVYYLLLFLSTAKMG